MPRGSRMAGLVVLLLLAAVTGSTTARAVVAASSQTTTAVTTTATLPATTEPTTTFATTATTAPLPASTATTAAATTASTTAATTAAATTKTTSTVPTRKSPPPSTAAQATSATQVSFAHECAVAAVALLVPGRGPLLLGPVASGSLGNGGLSGLAYPADGSIVHASDVSVTERGCGRAGPASTATEVRSLSLFAGAISASVVGLRDRSATVAGLTAAGRSVGSTPGSRVPLGSWGYVVVDPGEAPAPGGGLVRGGLAVHLLEAHAGLPAGAVVLVSVVGAPGAAKPGRAKRQTQHKRAGRPKRHVAAHEPLTVTPPLGLRRYVFPVAGPSDYGDTYGAFRSDVAGNWHHGDDIFAPLGTPVVAVAGGTINRVGWEQLGGWRLWVRDSVGDEFYYAHLSGYAPTDLQSNRVHAGEVIGFVGNTGDAFTTSPHLHFEIHPRQLLHLGYDGAVDPTSYLDTWTHVRLAHVPVPTHPALPSDPALEHEARFVFRELLAARHLIKRAPAANGRTKITIPLGANGLPFAAPPLAASPAAVASPGSAGATATIVELLVATTVIAATGMLLLPLRRRRRSLPARADDV